MNSSVTGVEEITPEQCSLSLTTSLKLFITQMHDRGFGPIKYTRSTKEGYTLLPWKIDRDNQCDAKRRPAWSHCSKSTGWRLANWNELHAKSPPPSRSQGHNFRIGLIAIDEAHFIFDWATFRSKYSLVECEIFQMFPYIT